MHALIPYLHLDVVVGESPRALDGWRERVLKGIVGSLGGSDEQVDDDVAGKPDLSCLLMEEPPDPAGRAEIGGYARRLLQRSPPHHGCRSPQVFRRAS